MLLDRIWQDLRIRTQPLYERLHTGDEDGPLQSSGWQHIIPKARRKKIAIFTLVTIVLILLLSRTSSTVNFRSASKQDSTVNPAAGFLHILLPANKANIAFCRSSLSSALLGYPLLQVVDREKEHGGEGPERGDLLATLRFLEDLPTAKDEDLVLLADKYDTWFQLRADVLIPRYRKINEGNEKRARKRLGSGVKELDLKHDLVFAAQKKCEASSKKDISCYAAPESPLPRDAFGASKNDAEQSSGVGVDSHPRFLHSGFVMGSVKSMRNAFRSAAEKWEQDLDTYHSRQEVFAEMFGEQEYRRELVRSWHLTRVQRLSRWWSGKTSFLETHQTVGSIRNDKASHDHGISLDYSGLLCQVVASAEADSDWIRYSDEQTISDAVTTLNITHPSTSSIEQDIEYSRPPFWSLAPMLQESSLPKDMAWGTFPLYTNLWTGITPAIILQNPDADQEQLNAQWTKMWYYPHLRAKLDDRVREPTYPIASERLVIPDGSGSGGSHEQKTWWTSVATSPVDKSREGIGFLVGAEEWKLWTDVCTEEEQTQIFGDGGPRWKDPKLYPPYDDLAEDSNL